MYSGVSQYLFYSTPRCRFSKISSHPPSISFKKKVGDLFIESKVVLSPFPLPSSYHARLITDRGGGNRLLIIIFRFLFAVSLDNFKTNCNPWCHSPVVCFPTHLGITDEEKAFVSIFFMNFYRVFGIPNRRFRFVQLLVITYRRACLTSIWFSWYADWCMHRSAGVNTDCWGGGRKRTK